MESLERSLTDACEKQIIPGAVVAATDVTGSVNYVKAFGYSLPNKKSKSTPLQTDSIFLIASCTKLLTSIAALQCVERGLCTLNEDVSSRLPELAALEILVKFDAEGKPVTRPRQNTIQVHHLLTHTAGLGYDHMSPKLEQYRKAMKQRLGGTDGTIPTRFNCPLLYEPGTSWGYSPAIDWLGLYVERVTGQSLEEYMVQYLWRPLNIKDMTFWPSKRPDLMERMSSMSMRDPEGSGQVVPFKFGLLNDKNTECFGGQGCYASMPEFLKILHSLLADDEKLLTRETTRQMFSPQLPSSAHSFLDSLRDRPDVWSHFIGEFPRSVELDWGLAGMLTVEATQGWRRKHTLVWSGLPNLFWFIDREAGVCGIFGCQILPPGDDATRELITAFEKAVYKRVQHSNARAVNNMWLNATWQTFSVSRRWSRHDDDPQRGQATAMIGINTVSV